jgi:hypothetical protein
MYGTAVTRAVLFVVTAASPLGMNGTRAVLFVDTHSGSSIGLASGPVCIVAGCEIVRHTKSSVHLAGMRQ